MDVRRLRVGEVVAALSGVLLPIALALPWYGYEGRGEGIPTVPLGDQEQTGFEAMAVVDLLLVAVAAGAIALALVTAMQRTVAIPIAHASLLTLAGLLAVVLVLFRLASVPDPPSTEATASLEIVGERLAGGWLALLAAIGVVAGGALAMRDERLSSGGRTTDATGRPAPRPPEIEPLPAPRHPKGSS